MTITEARAELVDALVADGVAATDTPGGADLPYVLVVADGIPELGHVVAGHVEAQFIARCVAGAWDSSAAVAALDELKLAALTVIHQLDGWRMGPVRRDGIRALAGADLLTADVVTSRLVTL